MNSRTLRLIIADDHSVVRRGVRANLAEHPIRFDVVAEVENGEGLLHALKTTPDVDVVITDFSMSKDGHDGLRLLRRIREQYPRLGIVVLTMLTNEALFRSIRSLGIQHIISKSAPERGLIHAVENAARNTLCTEGEDEEPIELDSPRVDLSGNRSAALSPREAETLRLLVTGMGVSEIARTLHRSKKTISAQKHAAMLKLGLENDAQLFRYLHDHFAG